MLAIGQQSPQYTQYLYNMSVVNPAYVINEPSMVTVGTLYRTQWVGIEGAPRTLNVFGHIPFSERLEMSVNFLSDQIGDDIQINENQFTVDMAYIMDVNDTYKLSFGLKAGFDQLSFQTKPSATAINTETRKGLFNLGAGAFFFSDHFYAGLSTPNFIPHNVKEGNQSLAINKLHLYAIAGYVFDVNPNWKLKPSIVLKETEGAPFTYDASLNHLLYETIELGVSYRHQDALAFLIGATIKKDLKLGYAYDFGLSDLNRYHDGSHEVFLIYNFDLLGLQKNYKSPRFY